MKIEFKNMKGEQKIIKLKDMQTYEALPCALNGEYYINGVYLESDDFGESYDDDEDYDYSDNEDMYYGCVNRVFKVWIDEGHLMAAIEKYNITQEEYFDIQNKLADLLYVGECGWCI